MGITFKNKVIKNNANDEVSAKPISNASVRAEDRQGVRKNRAMGRSSNEAVGTVSEKQTSAHPAIAGKEDVPRLRIRLYCHGLGDCILLRFRKNESQGTFNVLIDCGLITVADRPQARMTKVVNDIALACDDGSGHPRIDVVVMTHEHWDHVSGFHSQQARKQFDQIEVGEVWYAWTEDPSNKLGRRLRQEREEKLKAVASAVTALSQTPGMGKRAEGLGAMLGFFGIEPTAVAEAKIGKTRDAFDYLLGREDVKTRYLSPGETRALPGVAGIRVYVMGPPEDEGLIKRSSPTKKGQEVYELASEQQLASNLEKAFARMGRELDDKTDTYDDCPFDPNLQRRLGHSSYRSSQALETLISQTWDEFGMEWRKIETDWTQAAESIALNLDSHTNNTCLVLAFEFVDTGEVMLFPADAQVGNWLSWQNLRWKLKTPSGTLEVSGPDLISRTVFYKVGHHGSHNATLRALGLEQMASEDLIAFIPVSKAEAAKNRWMGMPFNPLVKRLREKTYGRLLVADEPKPSGKKLNKLTKAALARFGTAVSAQADDASNLWFEINFS